MLIDRGCPAGSRSGRGSDHWLDLVVSLFRVGECEGRAHRRNNAISRWLSAETTETTIAATKSPLPLIDGTSLRGPPRLISRQRSSKAPERLVWDRRGPPILRRQKRSKRSHSRRSRTLSECRSPHETSTSEEPLPEVMMLVRRNTSSFHACPTLLDAFLNVAPMDSAALPSHFAVAAKAQSDLVGSSPCRRAYTGLRENARGVSGKFIAHRGRRAHSEHFRLTVPAFVRNVSSTLESQPWRAAQDLVCRLLCETLAETP